MRTRATKIIGCMYVVQAVTKLSLSQVRWQVILFFFSIFIASAGHSATVETWLGAGPRACNGRCSQEWAEAQLTDTERTELRDKQSRQPDPQLIIIEDGAVFSLMSYYDERPVAYRSTTVAVLDHIEYAFGWQLDGWAFVKLEACSNWAIVATNQHVPSELTFMPQKPWEIIVQLNPTPLSIPPLSNPPGWPPEICCFTAHQPEAELKEIHAPLATAPVPLPLILLASALGSLVLAKTRQNCRHHITRNTST